MLLSQLESLLFSVFPYVYICMYPGHYVPCLLGPLRFFVLFPYVCKSENVFLALFIKLAPYLDRSVPNTSLHPFVPSNCKSSKTEMQGKTCDSLKCSSVLRLLQFSALLQAAAIIHSKILPWLFRDHVLLMITSVSLKNKREVLPIFSHKLIHLTVKFFFILNLSTTN